MLVVIEGIDASGKATQSQLLAAKLGGLRISFPNYTTVTGKILRAMLDERAYMMPAMYDAYAFQALQTVNRYEQANLIETMRAAGRNIVFDRYWASGIVYGGIDGVPEDWIRTTQAELPKPDAWVLLDISADESFRRRPENRDARYEARKALIAEVRERYLTLFNTERSRGVCEAQPKLNPWYVVDGMGTTEEVHARVCATLSI